MDRTRSDGPVVSGLSAAGFRVDDNVYRALAITPERADEWSPPPSLDALDEAALAPVLSLDPRTRIRPARHRPYVGPSARRADPRA